MYISCCKKTISAVLAVICLVISLFTGASAADTAAKELTGSAKFSFEGFKNTGRMTDTNVSSYSAGGAGATVTVTSDAEKIAGIYIMFDREYGAYTVGFGGSSVGQNEAFIHQYIDIASKDGGSASVRLSFPEDGVRISEIHVFSAGTLPAWVEKWSAPCEKADLLIVTTHADDEHLFFAGTIPHYAAAGYAVQVAYVTDHYDSDSRQHERLAGLWTAGVRNYPVFGRFEDAWSESLADAVKNIESSGKTRDDVVKFLAGTIRRFCPLVIMGQDFAGEYGHGQHMLAADALAEAVVSAADKTKYPDITFAAYDTPKIYFHQYDKNKITLDLDTPEEALGGKTPFEVSQAAFKCHESQLYTWFTRWLCGNESVPITKASEITTYSPCDYGLFRTTVGDDTGKNDLFEHIVPYFMRTPELAPEADKPDTVIPAVPESSDSGSSVSEALKISGYVLAAVVSVAVIVAFILFSISIREQKRASRRKKR